MGPLSKMLFATVLLVAIPAANAQSVNFNLTGTILPGTCSVSIPNVDLGTWQATLFTGVGSTPTTPVNVPITISGCAPLITRVNIALSGTPDAANATLFRGLPGIGIDIRSALNNSVIPDGSTPLRVMIPAGTGGATYTMSARFQQSAATMSYGSVNAPVVAAITYN